MPFIGQNKTKSSAADSMERSMNLRRSRMSGEWGRTSPELLASEKNSRRRMQTREQLASGQYFPNNINDRLKQRNEQRVTNYLQTVQQINSNSGK